MKKEVIKEIVLYILIYILFVVDLMFLNNFLLDNFFNYGFAYNIVHGLLPYKDFNTLLFPLSSFIMALVMKIFGSKLIIYYLFNSLVFTLIIFLIRKLNKSAFPYALLILLIYPLVGYNSFSLLFFFLIIYLEKNKKNDYLIGCVVSLAILTNQKMALLIIPALLIKDFKRILKRVAGMIIPFIVFLGYLLITNSFADFFDYAVLGLFEFGNSNFNKMLIILIFEFVIIAYLIYKYIKEKDIYILYGLTFQILALPILDPYHVSFASIPAAFLIFNFSKTKMQLVNRIISLASVCIISIIAINTLRGNDRFLNTNANDNYYLTLSSKKVDYVNKKLIDFYYENKKKYDEVYIIYGDTYYHKLKWGIKINKFDVISMGNNGHNGNKKLKEEIKKMYNSLFLLCERKEKNPYDQTNYEIIDFIRDNYKQTSCLNPDFCAYEIKNT